ncbi:transposase [uncultured Paludibaculum sp.]|uniref:transposase n=1 Tax=uncultured Paludibaculum sp. TaxID=1765020 RepID=UPI002AAB3815|nr:transposase [uncultured Paludibaculum sp.]
MAMGRRKPKQQGLWVSTDEIAKPAAHPFYSKVNEVLEEAQFDRKVEHLCQRFYSPVMGRPSVAPGVYFRMLLIGYCEGISSERGIAWRVADSLSLRQFLGYSLTDETPDHSSISRTRRLYALETHRAVFRWFVKILSKEGLLEAQTVAIDATTLEANAAMRSIQRRDDGRKYDEYLKDLAEAQGIENPTREQAARLDRKRKKKASNKEWKSPSDPDARIAKMKDGRTHLAHKAEHAVDLSSGAIVAVTLQAADQGDTTTVVETLKEAQSSAVLVNERGVEEVVADKGYHSGAVLVGLHQASVRSYIPEPERGRRKWQGRETEQERVYANRRRVAGERGRRLQKLRSELAERSFAHMYETGGMRRTHLRGRDNILKRLLIQAVAFNLALLVRARHGIGKPRTLQGVSETMWIVQMAAILLYFMSEEEQAFAKLMPAVTEKRPVTPYHLSAYCARPSIQPSAKTTSATGC